jgi:nucleoside-diphosphate-sugar epimerase
MRVLNEISDRDLILVTGASGFLSTHVIKQLLELGYRVRGTVRSLKNEKKIEPLRNLTRNPRHELELVEADLLSEKTWLDAVRDCTYVIHTASPVPSHSPKEENEVILPALRGVMNVFKACVQEGSKVKRVVLTSSMVAITGDSYITGKIYTEDDHADLDTASPYTRSKALAEKVAWEFLQERKENNQACFELAVLNPGLIIGPIFHDTFCASMEVPRRIMSGALWMCPDLPLPTCDARDVALAHIKVLTMDDVVGKRHLLISTREPQTFIGCAQWLRAEFESKGFKKIPTMVAPYFCVWLASFFDGSAAFVLPMLNKKPKFDTSRFVKILGMEPRDPKTSIIEMSYSMIEKGFIKKTINMLLFYSLAIHLTY